MFGGAPAANVTGSEELLAEVVVGSNRGPAGSPSLRFAHDDALSVAEALRQVGQFAPADVRVLFDPAPDAVLEALDSALAVAGGGESMLLFYYSGHADAQALYSDGRALAIEQVRKRLEDPAASVRVGIVDSCSGGRAKVHCSSSIWAAAWW